jgi:hypothetical protein
MVPVSKQCGFGFIPEIGLNALNFFRQSMAGIAAILAIKFRRIVTDR